ncbi:MAG: HypC/HybG/HupF family hydrogenase formation chaperone [Roseiarcus sp.]|jgi:hydrogenase assembly chaperone HypC/HupF
MCIAVPAEVVSIDGPTALVDVYGKRFVVSLMTLSEPVEPGDFVAVMAQRYAMSKIAREDAEAAKRFLEGVFAELADGGEVSRVG